MEKLSSPLYLCCMHQEETGGEKLWVCVTEMSKVCSITSVIRSPFCLSAMAMPSSLLWAVDIFGRVYTLSTVGQYWELCKDAQLEFKRVSAVKQCCWGIACDHQVYTYVFSGDVPIRYQEETYENQRWNPVGGFCEKLLPSDRWQWSDVSGLKHQQLDSFTLPSPHWEWESDWYVDENIGGEPTEKGGWTYAIDFPSTYTKDKKWNSCVRRRRWIRYRRYKSRDVWAKIVSQDDPDKLPDPFNDISIGGWEITDEPLGRLSVWAVSLQGRVWYRENVCQHNPEGSMWSLITTPGEVVQISCGPYDLLWATLWEGQAIVREGIDRNNPQGISWSIVESPSSENGIMHVSVGVDVVWCVTKDRKVWFRRGVNSHNPCGTSWIEMVGEMMMVTVGLNNQVSHRVSSVGRHGRQLCLAERVTDLRPGAQQACSGLSSSVQSLSLSITPAQTAAWRKQIFQQLSERTKRELENFRHYEQAIEQSVWVKTGTLQWWRNWKPHKWMDVRVALEQFTGSDGIRDSILFIYYMYYEEKKYIHVFLNEVTILVEVLNEAKHSFALYTPERTKQRWPIRLAATTEQEMHDWLSLLNMSCCESRRIQGPPSHHAIWSVTCKGDIFVSEPSPELEDGPQVMPCDQMFWRQVGGHLRLVECNNRGIVWGIGYDHTAWVYTGGYGGGFIQGLASSADNIYTQSDVKCVYIYENQRWNPVTGYSSRGLPTDRYMWSDASGLQECTKLNTKPPSPQWTWVSDWYIDFNTSGGTDREGWQYAADFPASYHGHKTMKDFVRRRRWARKCKIVTNGPWLEVPPVTLWDISIIPSTDADGEEAVALWAISDKGDVLCRLGVTQQNPAGTSWLHVGTDQPFISISVGAFYQVWAIARDGSAFYRGSVSQKKPAGDCWYHIPSPQKQKLKQVSVGRTSVFVLDKNGNLWYRQGITPSYPQGSTWDHVSNNIRKMSIGPLDQVWVIADKVQGSHSLSCGTVCHRTGVQPMEPKGLSWDYGIGGGWEHISVRGNATEASRLTVHDISEENLAVSKDLEDEEGKGKTEHSKSLLMFSESQELDRSGVNC
ncbi:tectonin beta-propeller repeat-containing protein 1 isoform X6 [Lathamus discolor]|uniref:tectonin beta-propeller repeat-containing protein 1 isoform X6 n=1 Tax=Lathamus discolor TaxID=678569 RepID=UPI0032B7C285